MFDSADETCWRTSSAVPSNDEQLSYFVLAKMRSGCECLVIQLVPIVFRSIVAVREIKIIYFKCDICCDSSLLQGLAHSQGFLLFISRQHGDELTLNRVVVSRCGPESVRCSADLYTK